MEIFIISILNGYSLMSFKVHLLDIRNRKLATSIIFRSGTLYTKITLAKYVNNYIAINMPKYFHSQNKYT